MSYRMPNGLLDDTHEWQNNNDRVAYERGFQSGAAEDQKMAMALTCADPATPESFIRASLTDPEMPARYGYTDEEPTIDDVLAIGSARTRQAGVPQMGQH